MFSGKDSNANHIFVTSKYEDAKQVAVIIPVCLRATLLHKPAMGIR